MLNAFGGVKLALILILTHIWIRVILLIKVAQRMVDFAMLALISADWDIVSVLSNR
jgi:hypothetical protein